MSRFDLAAAQKRSFSETVPSDTVPLREVLLKNCPGIYNVAAKVENFGFKTYKAGFTFKKKYFLNFYLCILVLRIKNE